MSRAKQICVLLCVLVDDGFRRFGAGCHRRSWSDGDRRHGAGRARREDRRCNTATNVTAREVESGADGGYIMTFLPPGALQLNGKSRDSASWRRPA